MLDFPWRWQHVGGYIYIIRQRNIFLTLSLLIWNFNNTHNMNLQRLKNIVSLVFIWGRTCGWGKMRSAKSLLEFSYRRQANVLPFSFYIYIIYLFLNTRCYKFYNFIFSSGLSSAFLIISVRLQDVWYQSGQMLFLIATIFHLLLSLRVLDKSVNFKWSSLSPTV